MFLNFTLWLAMPKFSKFADTFKVLFLFCAVVIAPSLRAESSPAFWQVHSKTATVYLFGSMHFGDESFYPLPRVVTDAFLRSSVLVVEVDVTKIKPMDALGAIMRHGRLPDGKTLSDVLSKETMALLKAQTEKSGLPLTAMQAFKPWFAALQLVEAEIRKTKYKQNYGIDQYFLSQAKGKTVDQLESLDSQLAMFANLSLKQQEKFLYQTLKDFSQSQSYLDEMALHWKTGNVDALASTLLTPFKSHPETEALYKTVFTDRNVHMVNAVAKYLKSDKTVFFVVGAGHMVGEDGIVQLLQQKGLAPTMLSPGTSAKLKTIVEPPKPVINAENIPKRPARSQ